MTSVWLSAVGVLLPNLPSDWQRIQVFVKLLSDLLQAGKPSSLMYAALQRDMDALLVSEPERRRAQMEISRVPAGTSAEDAVVAQVQEYRRIAEEPYSPFWRCVLTGE